MTDNFTNYIEKVEEIKQELEGCITNKDELNIYIDFRLEGMAEVGAIEMLNSFGLKELKAIARFRRLYNHYFPNELAQQNKRYRDFFQRILELQLYINYTEEELWKEVLKISEEALEGEE